MMSAGPVPESAAALLIRSQVNHNKLLSAFLVLAVIGNAAVIAAFAVGFTHQPAAALYVAGAVAVFGQVQVDLSDAQGPGGDPSCTPVANYGPQSATFPAPSLACWSLVARIGGGAPFEIGEHSLVTATSGELYLGVNDGDFSDNSGSWTVRIKIGGMPPAA